MSRILFRILLSFTIVIIQVASARYTDETYAILYNHLPRPTNNSSDQEMSLSSVPHDTFAVLSHSIFPGRSARIKKSRFCNGEELAYTGYVDIGTRHLFFWFFESRSDPDNDDVVFWTNGASSSAGLLMELGPCNVIGGNETAYNAYAWNTKANVFFIDQPVGTGFSYSDLGERVKSTEEAAVDVAAFIVMFFETFPKYRGRALHLAGESYAGRYLPIFAAQIYDQNEMLSRKGIVPINIKTLAIGNAATSWFHMVYSYHDVTCTGISVDPVQSIEICVRMKHALPRCKKWIKQECLSHFDLMNCNAALRFCWEELVFPYEKLGLNLYDMTKICESNNTLCYKEQGYIEEYLNQPWVRKELGIDPSFGNFSSVSMDVQQTLWSNGDNLHRTELYIAELLERGIRVLIYAGTLDWISNWVANERWMLEMEWSGQAGFQAEPLEEWYVDETAVGKLRTHQNLRFMTIYGAGHMVPHDKPAVSLAMLNSWLEGMQM